MYASMHSSPLFFLSPFFALLSNLNRTPRPVFFRMVISFVVLPLSVLHVCATSQHRNNNNYSFISQVCSNFVSRHYAWVFTRVHPQYSIVNFHTDQLFILYLPLTMYYSARCEIFWYIKQVHVILHVHILLIHSG